MWVKQDSFVKDTAEVVVISGVQYSKFWCVIADTDTDTFIL